MTTLPATLPDLDAIEAGYTQSLALFREAFQKIADADEAVRRAHAAVEAVTPGARTHSNYDADEIKAFNKAISLPDGRIYMQTATQLITLRCWNYVVERCSLNSLMDAQARKELDTQLRYVPMRPTRRDELIDQTELLKGAPPFTAETVRATLAKFMGDANFIWQRGIANAFSSLDRRFRSHDGFKVGSRVILTRFANDHGGINTHGDVGNRFRDIERAFQVLDGRPATEAQAIFLNTIDHERRSRPRSYTPAQTDHETEYFRVRIYKNGNAHLWFSRDDLVEKINTVLAAYYGEVLGDARPADEDPFERRAITPARNFGFFPTPADLSEKIIASIPFREAGQRILEPSAGSGALAIPASRPLTISGRTDQRRVDVVEIQPKLYRDLVATGRFQRHWNKDFLSMQPSTTGPYDGNVMNPPFDRERDIDHITHALSFLKPDGWLMAIMSAGVEYRETRKSAAFRRLLAKRHGWIIDLPPGSFASVGANVNTVLIGVGLRRPWF